MANKKVTVDESVEVKADLYEKLKTDSPELLPDIYKYIHPPCSQIAYYTKDPDDVPIEDCPHCHLAVSPIDVLNLVMCSEEEALKFR